MYHTNKVTTATLGVYWNGPNRASIAVEKRPPVPPSDHSFLVGRKACSHSGARRSTAAEMAGGSSELGAKQRAESRSELRRTICQQNLLATTCIDNCTSLGPPGEPAGLPRRGSIATTNSLVAKAAEVATPVPTQKSSSACNKALWSCVESMA